MASTRRIAVGYGDVTPVTIAGRAAGLVAMMVGISTFAVITARVAAFLVVDEPGDDISTRGENSAVAGATE